MRSRELREFMNTPVAIYASHAMVKRMLNGAPRVQDVAYLRIEHAVQIILD
jgi:hypothetical protein